MRICNLSQLLAKYHDAGVDLSRIDILTKRYRRRILSVSGDTVSYCRKDRLLEVLKENVYTRRLHGFLADFIVYKSTSVTLSRYGRVEIDLGSIHD